MQAKGLNFNVIKLLSGMLVGLLPLYQYFLEMNSFPLTIRNPHNHPNEPEILSCHDDRMHNIYHCLYKKVFFYLLLQEA